MELSSAPSAPALGKTSEIRFEALDALRGILAIIVCVGHAWQTFMGPVIGHGGHVGSGGDGGVANGMSGGFIALMAIGGLAFASARAAVLCFFCLSGFVIALSVERNVVRHGRFAFGDFSLARAVRLLPPLLIAIIVPAVLSLLLRALHLSSLPDAMRGARAVYETSPLQQLLAICTLGISGDLTGGLNRPLWTLAYEIELYAIVALVLFATSARRPPIERWLAAAALVFYVVLVLDQSVGFNRNDIGFQLVCAASFALGWTCFRLRKSLPTKLLARAVPIAWMATVALCILGALTGAMKAERVEEAPLVVAAELAFSIGACALVARMSLRGAHTSLARLGVFSYTLYVVHYPLLVFLYFVLRTALPLSSIGVATALFFASPVLVIALCKWIGQRIETPAAQKRWIERTFLSMPSTTRSSRGLQ